jgi:hypothetical protein
MECPHCGEEVNTNDVHIIVNQRPVDSVCFIAANLDQIKTIVQGIENDQDLRTLFPKK